MPIVSGWICFVTTAGAVCNEFTQNFEVFLWLISCWNPICFVKHPVRCTGNLRTSRLWKGKSSSKPPLLQGFRGWKFHGKLPRPGDVACGAGHGKKKTHAWNFGLGGLTNIEQYEWEWYTLQGTNISPKKWHFEDDFPFPKVGYLSSLEGYIYTLGSSFKVFFVSFTLILEGHDPIWRKKYCFKWGWGKETPPTKFPPFHGKSPNFFDGKYPSKTRWDSPLSAILPDP